MHGKIYWNVLQAFDFLQLMSAMAATFNLDIPLQSIRQNMAYRRSAFLQVGGLQQGSPSNFRGWYPAHATCSQIYQRYPVIRRRSGYFCNFQTASDCKKFAQPEKKMASNGAYQIFFNCPVPHHNILLFLFVSNNLPPGWYASVLKEMTGLYKKREDIEKRFHSPPSKPHLFLSGFRSNIFLTVLCAVLKLQNVSTPSILRLNNSG